MSAAGRTRTGRTASRRSNASTLLQIQPNRVGAACSKVFAATIKIPTHLLDRIESDDAIRLAFAIGSKENDLNLLIGSESHKIRCAREDPNKCDIMQADEYESPCDDEEGGDDASGDRGPTYHGILHPQSHLALAYRYYLPKQLNDDAKASVAQKTHAIEKAARQNQTKTVEALVAKEAMKMAAESAAQSRQRKLPPAKRKDVASEEDATARKRKKVDTPLASTPILATPKSIPSPSSLGVVRTPNSSSAASPTTAPALTSPHTNTTGNTKSTPTLTLQRLTRSPSTAALPSDATKDEKLRARLAHFLAAQARGLPMSTLVNRIGVPPEDMKSTLSQIASYVAPGYYDLKNDVYLELKVSTWADYTDSDRRMVVTKMLRKGIHVDPDIRRAYEETIVATIKPNTPNTNHTPTPQSPTSSTQQGGDSQPTLECAHDESPDPSIQHAASAIIDPILDAPWPPLPDLASLPDSVPVDMLVHHTGVGVDIGDESTRLADPPPTINDYMTYLTMQTQFIQQHRAYKMIEAWLTAAVTRTRLLKSALSSQSDPLVRSRVKKALVRFCTDTVKVGCALSDDARREYECRCMGSEFSTHACMSKFAMDRLFFIQVQTSIEPKQRILHLILRSLRGSLLAYTQQHHLHASQTIRADMAHTLYPHPHD